MSYLERLLNNVTSQKGSFTNSYPVIAEFQSLNNSLIEKAIRESGDQDGKRTRAKCFRTRWDLHEVCDEVHKIGTAAIRLAQKHPLEQGLSIASSTRVKGLGAVAAALHKSATASPRRQNRRRPFP